MLNQRSRLRRALKIIVLIQIGGLFAVPLQAQEEAACWVLCSPEVALEPSVTVGPIFRVATVEDVSTGETSTPSATAAFELVAAVDVPTALPRVGLTGEVIWKPFVDDNPVELELELNLMLLTAAQTGGWAEVHFDIVDQLSPAERPDDTRLYTHKLNLELDASVAPFHRFEQAGYLRGVELEGSLDYLATGLPQEGDVVAGERFLDDASPWSFAAVLIFPIAPLRP